MTTRKYLTAQEKMALLRRHLIEKTPVSTLCDEAQLQPTVFYRWPKQLFENGAVAFERANGQAERPDRRAQHRIAQLEDRLRTQDKVLAELKVYQQPDPATLLLVMNEPRKVSEHISAAQ